MSMGTTPLEHLNNTKPGGVDKTQRNLSTSLAGSWIHESPDLPHDISGDSTASMEVRNFVARVCFKMVVYRTYIPPYLHRVMFYIMVVGTCTMPLRCIC